MKGTVLLVDDQESIVYAMRRVLSSLGYSLVSAGSIAEATPLLAQADVAILDLRLNGESGMTLLETIHQRQCSLPVIILSAWATPDDLVQGSRYGAVDILRKPIGTQELNAALERAFATIQQPVRQPVVASGSEPADVWTDIVGTGAAMMEVFKLLGLAASNRLSVLLTGETGVGKDVAARLIHLYSANPEAPFVAINTTAIPSSLFEAELFGYAAGAFTGARQDTPGRIEGAAGGTLFLDEIGDLPLASQAKLLRFLEDRTFSRLGESVQRKVDIRLVAATNQRLAERVAEGLFREDLYYRLAQLPIEIPPLRQRVEDIPVLAERFLLLANRELGLKLEGFSEQALHQLVQYPWPGNVRELKNIIFRSAAHQYAGRIDKVDIQGGIQASQPVIGNEGLMQMISEALAEEQIQEFCDFFQRQVLIQALEHFEGNKSRVAEVLNMSRNTLRAKLRACGLESEG